MKIIFMSYIPANSRIFNLTAFLLFFIIENLFSGSRFVGIVTDKNNVPIQDVNIEMYPTSLGTTTDENGYFYFSRIDNGKYILNFHHISYEPQKLEVVSGVEDKVKIKIQLENSSIELNPITISKISSFGEKKIIEYKQISNSNSSNLVELLQDHSSISIDKTDGINTKISIRGSESKQVSVMLDGIIINSTMDGSFDINTIPVEIVDHIEIYKGGDLTLSSQGMGGIINVITKKQIKNKELSINYSNSGYFSDRDEISLHRFNNNQISTTLSWPFKIGNLIFSYANRRDENNWSYINVAKADEYRYINNPNIPRVQINAYNNSNNIYSMFNGNYKKIKYGIALSYNSIKYGMPGWYDQLYESAYLERDDLSFKIFYDHKINNDINLKINTYQDNGSKHIFINEIDSFYFVDNKDKYSNKGIKISTSYNSELFNLFSGLDLFAGVDLFSRLDLFAGVEYKEEEVESEMIVGYKQFRENSSAFSKVELVQNIFSDNYKFHIQGGIREEYFSNTNEFETLYSYGTFIEILHGSISIIPKFGYQKNYRLPTFSSMFWADNLYSSGNPDLKPEFSSMYDGALAFSFTNDKLSTSLSFSYYNKELDDLIVWVKKSTGKYMPENLRGGEISGTESDISFSYNDLLKDLIVWVKKSTGKYMPENLRGGEISGTESDIRNSYNDFLKLSFSLNTLSSKQFTDNIATHDKEIIYKPNKIFSAKVEYTYKDFKVGYISKYNGHMFLNETNSIDIDPFWLHNIQIAYTKVISEHMSAKFYLSSDNLLDEQYQVIYGYPMPGRKIETGIKFKIK
ncbi:MAG: TonB-dependent receptor plug domain-containing protein [Candidatus Delongbacteria bacterium]|nr:TonB-dependent receptor plug domain-containing protein [Candidatus Delongbacteria bacterium]